MFNLKYGSVPVSFFDITINHITNTTAQQHIHTCASYFTSIVFFFLSFLNQFDVFAFYSQDDKVMGTLTVRENIMFSANLRLRKHISAKQKKQMVEDTIQELGLDRCADTKVRILFPLVKTFLEVLFYAHMAYVTDLRTCVLSQV